MWIKFSLLEMFYIQDPSTLIACNREVQSEILPRLTASHTYLQFVY